MDYHRLMMKVMMWCLIEWSVAVRIIDKIVVWSLPLLAIAMSCLGCCVLHQEHYDKVNGQIVVLILGVLGILGVVYHRRVIFDPRCIISLLIATLCMCAIAVFQAPYPWIRATLYVGGATLTPGYFLPLVFELISYILCLKNVRTILLIFVVMGLSIVAELMIQPEMIRIMLVTGCAVSLARFSTGSDAKWSMATVCVFAALAISYALHPLTATHDVFLKMGIDIAKARLALLSTAPWIGESSGDWPLVYCCDETVFYSLIHVGRAIVLGLACVAITMAALIAYMTFRVIDPAKRMVVLGCGASLIAPMCLSFLQFAPCHIGHYSFPFVTPSGSLWMAAYVELGLIIGCFVEEVSNEKS